VDILERLHSLDIVLFYLINHSMSSPFMDGFMLFMTKMDFSKVLMITVVSIYAVFKGRGRAVWVIVLAGVAVGLTDQLSSHLLKDVFERIRPCHILPDVHLLARCPSSFSFPSSHAANFSSAATVLIGYVPMSALVMIPLTLVVAASRVSVGVHWPSDVIGGIIIGAVSGFVVVLLSRKVRNSWKESAIRRDTGDTGWFLFYTTVMSLLFPVILFVYGRGILAGRQGRAGWRERLGRVDPIGGRPLWIHAASVGETAAAVALIEQIRADRGDIPVVLSVNTPAARSIAAARLKGGTVCYFPLDFPWVVRRALDRIDPRAVIFMEAEIWPAFAREAAHRKIPLLLVNGRMSEKTYRRFRYISGFIRRVLGRFSLVTAQSAEYGERYTTLGCDPSRVLVTGNIKYDIGPGKEKAADDLKRFMSARKRAVLIAGSTHGGEEEIVLDAFMNLAGRFPDLLLILAPRHLARTGDVERLLKSRTIGYVKRSRLPADGHAPSQAVLLLDTLGELAGLLAFGDAVFIGGSLVAGIGGHNVLEAAAVGKPAVFGPFMGNFPQISRGLIEAGGGFVVRDAHELTEIAARLIADRAFAEDAGRQALDLVRGNRGATAQTAAAVARYLSEAAGEDGA
jgi:3-deoxy-D-manno-octulosonic-acid transferase